MRDETGANAVEFALVLPILVVLIFGILYGGMVINAQMSVTQAARESARYGATLPLEIGGPDGDWFVQIRERAVLASAGTLGGSDNSICLWFIEGTSPPTTQPDPDNPVACGSPPAGLTAGTGDRIVVAVSRPATLDFVLYAFPTTLSGHAVARHEAGIPEAEST